MKVSSNQSTDQPQTTTTSSTGGVSETSLEALYVLNKHAKQYAEQATENYRDGKKTTAKANSNKKKALYAVKARVLSQIHREATHVAVHVIDDTEFYYFEFGDWGYHTPVNGVLDIDDERVETREELPEFTKTSEKKRSSMSLKASLKHVRDEFRVNANKLLPEQYLWYGSNRYFIGWKYLG